MVAADRKTYFLLTNSSGERADLVDVGARILAIGRLTFELALCPQVVISSNSAAPVCEAYLLASSNWPIARWPTVRGFSVHDDVVIEMVG